MAEQLSFPLYSWFVQFLYVYYVYVQTGNKKVNTKQKRRKVN